ncbi:hypothetical protein K432DRAFT_304089 [Lepidopterella palustris CBS 459.81]|uniref:Uncharacterized protein n=1 Tax=Lepidopterella palustris CBS 459.81 TaxID=1314670 RepID=A0A8E2E5D0_9PEZI|nr:hypothetical protein K432DRAFT_304089 [Lepidopterella palustris CBS 459.81]
MRKSPQANEEVSALSVLRPFFGRGTTYDLPDKVTLEIFELSESFIRPDLLEFLKEALPRWKKNGLWLQEQLPEPLTRGTGREKLLNAYSCICRLESRMGDDQIRNKMAVIMLHSAYEQACKEWRACGTQGRKRKGRGDASSVIDEILERLHDDWNQSDRKVQLRSRFHDKKRYGKRWLILTKALGMSLLIACSPKITSVV